ncbi:MAG: alpha/beta hydrolase [Burkholderiales bacterium]|nr:alpha/beta hydrolase [Burkholderiales bacterium]
MPYAKTGDGIRLYWEECGTGDPVVFIHEYAGDYRSWGPQVRFFARRYRCIAFNARGYPPSDVPLADAAYSQAIAREDVIAVMDAAGARVAHVVGHSMGAYTALHVALDHPQRCRSLVAAGCGWGSQPGNREAMMVLARETGEMFRNEGIVAAARKYASAPMRAQFQAKDPRGFEEFVRWMSEHSAEGHALTMFNLQLRRPTIAELEPRLRGLHLPTLVIVGDEDEPCLDGSLMLKRTIANAGLLMLPCAGHTINSEEPAAFNGALAEFFAAVEHGRWRARPAV